jgi:hypothetical protein
MAFGLQNGHNLGLLLLADGSMHLNDGLKQVVPNLVPPWHLDDNEFK